MEIRTIKIYTDGSCLGNPGKGGWAYCIIENKFEIYGHGFIENTTNNRMELMAIISALNFIKKMNANIEIFTDSMYVKNGIELWVKNWKKNGWKSSGNKPIKNDKLWIDLDSLVEDRKKYGKIDFFHVKAHSGIYYNEMVDHLARTGEIMR